MSYDLTVYAADGLREKQLEALVESIPGLAVGDSGDHRVTVLRGKREAHAFTVFGPHELEARDIPDDVVAHVLDPTTSWHVVAAGGDTTDVRPARRFAKALAHAAGGVAVDEQTDDILGPRRIRKTARPPAGSVRILDLRWYSPASAPYAPNAWIETAKRFLPEALPRRFGNAYPLEHRLDRDGDDRFISTYCDVAWFDATFPCLDGGLYPNEWDRILVDRLRLVAEPLEDPRWRNTVRRFFVEYARRRGSVLATGEVLRGHRLSGPADPDCDLSASLRGPDGILGLPANPIWWTWLGNDYLPLAGSFLPAGQATRYDEGALYVPIERPADRAELARRPDPFPKWLRAVALPSACGFRSVPHNGPAAIRPIVSRV
ncbi:hypothetical protein [Mycobacterium sp. Marseille-P9652]|uniref:hypothetical protein n=1 Tax=Mycobacterium sp. Marseille-P9652 TaxID=2654950 RepID=UPI0012E849E7|nr:hypothetical protein [Mycobacterium sp. Marseille-P9652]